MKRELYETGEESIMQSRFKAMIFDMDGTLIDSMEQWYTIWHEYVEENHIPLPPELVGQTQYGCSKACKLLAQILGKTYDEVRDGMEQLLQRHYMTDVMPKPQAGEVLDALRAQGYRVGVATATRRGMAQSVLERHGLWEKLDFFCSTDDFGISKSDPEFFRKVAALAGAQVSQCVMFEDALYAISGARQADMCVVAIEEPIFSHDREKIMQRADRYIHSWQEMLSSLPMIVADNR